MFSFFVNILKANFFNYFFKKLNLRMKNKKMMKVEDEKCHKKIQKKMNSISFLYI